jgi:hypothetical protein
MIMNSIKNYLLLFVTFFTLAINADSQEIAEQLNRAKSLPYGSAQLNIILDVLKLSSGASSSQRQEAENFPVFKDRQSYWSGR